MLVFKIYSRGLFFGVWCALFRSNNNELGTIREFTVVGGPMGGGLL
jgi:hypothetical protein